MENTFHAHHWGIKAAQAELPESSNPYRTSQTRAAWLAGYRQAFQRCPAPAR
ncbi:ribosome modulation factor [Novosphingobium fluoreni]|uniref:Ribosome modulation factor n=1 Tax=Novosphingobium fluoreni TaxID=1391222 RepID=A0A7W6FWX9_9SPHN|nr:Rmf/CrpP family protein [Novosphingobium fluoreni]MBB3938656.1 ribosome modulation factor [Novosphingobium fluoreni]